MNLEEEVREQFGISVFYISWIVKKVIPGSREMHTEVLQLHGPVKNPEAGTLEEKQWRFLVSPGDLYTHLR